MTRRTLFGQACSLLGGALFVPFGKTKNQQDVTLGQRSMTLQDVVTVAQAFGEGARFFHDGSQEETQLWAHPWQAGQHAAALLLANELQARPRVGIDQPLRPEALEEYHRLEAQVQRLIASVAIPKV